ncbi:MAG: hypothetical protein HQK83_08645 [Fibrobacteria bacterium]|nr:hypothetical protein [Fibrobacteria bacterium]
MIYISMRILVLFMWASSSVAFCLCNSDSLYPDGDFLPLIKANMSESGKVQVKEAYTTSLGQVFNSRFDVFWTKYGETIGIVYHASNANPKKSILMANCGEDIWSLDSAGGQVRKIAPHKKREPINYTGLSYWDIFPYVLIDRFYRKGVTIQEDGLTTKLSVSAPKRSPYSHFVFQYEKKSKKLRQVKYFNFKKTHLKTIDFTLSGKKDRAIPFTKITLYHHVYNTKIVHQIIKSEKGSTFPEKLLNIPFTR